ncbi:MAG: formylglycine-generating enzyme family protein [Dongiaceae bacterium]
MAWRVLAALTLFCRGAIADSAPNLSGEWYFDVASPNGPGRREVLFKQEGSRIIGFVESDSASGRLVGSFDGVNLDFTAVLEFGGEPMAAVYKAKVDGDRMSGSIDFGLYGKATFLGYRGRRPLATQPGKPLELVGSAKESGVEARSVEDFFGVSHNGLLIPEMRDVPAGHFEMGNNGPAVNPDFSDDYDYVHRVEVSDFRLSRFLVTNAQYMAFCKATGRQPPLPPRGWEDYLQRYPNHPVANVSWDDADAYVKWLSELTGETFRLPTEAQWEYAARAGVEGEDYVFGNTWKVAGANTSTFHMGREVDRESWKTWWDAEGETMARSKPMTTRVGTFPPNRWGFYDMVGNVWEWMSDWHQADYYRESPAKDPAGPAMGKEKVLRGCSWYNKPDVCFIATRDRYAPDRRLYYNGFRVAAGR